MNRRYIYFTLIAILLPLTSVFSQEQLSLRDRGNQHFERFEYARAAEIFTSLAEQNKPRLHDIERAAESYFLMRDFEKAQNWYARVVAHQDHKAAHVLRYGDALKANGQYEQAREQYKKYAGLKDADTDVTLRIAGSDSALVWRANPTEHLIRNEAAVNTAGSEFSAMPIGDRVFYAGEPAAAAGDYGWTGRPFIKLHHAEAADAGLAGKALASGELNGEDYHVGPVATPDGGNTLYVTRTYPGRSTGVEREGKQRYRTQRLELYIYTQQNGQWVGEPFPYNDPTGYSVGHATFSADGKLLYFVSDRPGGQGGTDIWYSERQGDNWGQPVNAGPVINTSGDEVFPQIDQDGVLYYSSDGLAGMGGLDVFQTKGGRNQWSTPVNLGYPINSPADDFSLVTVEDNDLHTRGYLSSNRVGGVGEDDIYSFVLNKPQPIVVVLAGKVTHKTTGNALPGARVQLWDADGSAIAEVTSGPGGAFVFPVDLEQRYQVHGSMVRFDSDLKTASTMGIIKSDTIWVDLALEPEMVVGKTFVLEDLYYDFDKHNIRPDAALVLDELVETMNEYPTMKIELSSHTDSRGSDAYNMALSDRRAKSAVAYLISKGISADRLVAAGYGETRHVNECANGVQCTEEQHQANRRTEVKVLEIQH